MLAQKHFICGKLCCVSLFLYNQMCFYNILLVTKWLKIDFKFGFGYITLLCKTGFSPELCGFFYTWMASQTVENVKNALVQGMDWKLKKKQPMSKERLWNNFRKPGELLLTLKYYMEVWLLGSKRKEWQETFAQCCKFSLIISFLYFRNNKVLLLLYA